LPDGSRLSPDAVWCDAKRWQAAQRKGTRRPPFSPDFVIEVRAPDDRLPDLQAKMEVYMANGVQLGWLIDPKQRKVYIYRRGADPEVLEGPTEVHGEGPVGGFVLGLEEVFD
jgi:Uma2 family endonuclease